jgi:hypothetical protein
MKRRRKMPVKGVTADDTRKYIFWITKKEFNKVCEQIIDILKIKPEDYPVFNHSNINSNDIKKSIHSLIASNLNLARFLKIGADKFRKTGYKITKKDIEIVENIFKNIPSESEMQFKIYLSDLLLKGLSRDEAEKYKILLNKNRAKTIKFLILDAAIMFSDNLHKKIGDFNKFFKKIENKLKLEEVA